MKTLFTFLTALILTATARAGTFSTAAWTNDGSSGIVEGQTSWAHHFGSSSAATVNNVPVSGSATGAPLVVDGRFTLNGADQVFNGDTNNLTTGGSVTIASDFVYGGSPAAITLLGLTAGQGYTVSFLSVGWEFDPDAAFRTLTFASGSDSLAVQQSEFGTDNGIRIDYTFTAEAATRVITVAASPAPDNATFHLYGLALRQLPAACAPLAIQLNANGTVTASWPDACQLQATPSLEGSPVWQTIAGATSPYTTPASGSQRFLRTVGASGVGASPNVVGYVNLTVPRGRFLYITNPLNQVDNTVENVVRISSDLALYFFINGGEVGATALGGAWIEGGNIVMAPGQACNSN